jgi:hypothetical protein
MQDEVARRDRLRPAVVGGEIGRREGQPVPGVGTGTLEHRAHVGLARERAHSRSHLVPRAEELQDAVRPHEARPARNKHRSFAHPRAPLVSW